jgi:antitoxin (DNA-binding transcriptional repressor) of toxin-antitoxin stability system
MHKTVTMAYARKHLHALVREAEQGTAIQITRLGKPVAVIVFTQSGQTVPQRKVDFWEKYLAFRQQFDLAELES